MKRKQTILLLSILWIGFATSFTSCSSKDDPEPTPEVPEVPEEPEEVPVVNFPDEVLKGIVKLNLGLIDANGDPDASKEITEENILELTELNVTGETGHEEIKDITGLEKAVNLTLLNLGETQVTDISPIAALRKIEYLRFNNTPLSDLSPIEEYTSLTYFNINTATNITDISPLAGNVNLGQLILRDVPMGDAGMEVIRNFTKIYRLNMRNTGVTDISVLGELMDGGALLKTTPGAADIGSDAEIDLRQNDIASFDPIRAYVEDETAISVQGFPSN